MTPVLRKPFYGVIHPGGTMAVHVAPPMDGTQEKIIAVASAPNEVTFTPVKPDTIVVQSKSNAPVAWGLMIVPVGVFGPAPQSPIGQLIARVGEIFARLRGGAMPT